MLKRILKLLRAYKDYRRIFDEMYYWAPAGGIETEVDFLLLKNGIFSQSRNFGSGFSHYLIKIRKPQGYTFSNSHKYTP